MTLYGEQIRRSIVRRRRLKLAAKLLLPLAFVGTCVDKGYNDRWFWRVGVASPEIVAETLDVTGRG